MGLVDRIRGERRRPRNPGEVLTGPEAGQLTGEPGVPAGIVIDGAVYGLDGQPPPARGGTWGDMGWAMRDLLGRPITSRS
jgi:hypothetical protein